MRIAVTILGLLAFVTLAPSNLAAQEGCLSQTETVAAVRSGKVMPYDEAVPRNLRNSGEFLGVRLCADSGALVYVVSTLERGGRVTHTAVDATSGKIVGQR